MGDRLKVTARCHNVTTLTTDPTFRRVVVVILWFGSKGSDQFSVLLTREQAEKTPSGTHKQAFIVQ